MWAFYEKIRFSTRISSWISLNYSSHEQLRLSYCRLPTASLLLFVTYYSSTSKNVDSWSELGSELDSFKYLGWFNLMRNHFESFEQGKANGHLHHVQN